MGAKLGYRRVDARHDTDAEVLWCRRDFCRCDRVPEHSHDIGERATDIDGYLQSLFNVHFCRFIVTSRTIALRLGQDWKIMAQNP